MEIIKHFTLLLFIALAAEAVKLIDPLKSSRDKCRNKEGLSKEALYGLRDNLRELGGYFLCLLQEEQAITEDGEVDQERIEVVLEPLIPKQLLEPILSCCKREVLTGDQSCLDNGSTVIADYVGCWKHKLPVELTISIGILNEPVYKCLDGC